MSEVLCTRRDFERARADVLEYFQKHGYAARRMLSNFRVWGLPYEAIELAIRDLRQKGIIEELYTMPPPMRRTGQRKEYYGLTTALDTRAIQLPEGIVRESQAFKLIADYEAETA